MIGVGRRGAGAGGVVLLEGCEELTLFETKLRVYNNMELCFPVVFFRAISVFSRKKLELKTFLDRNSDFVRRIILALAVVKGVLHGA